MILIPNILPRRLAAILASMLTLPTTTLLADVKLPAILSDNMCLQAGRPLPIWGTADAGEQVTVELLTQRQSTTADAAGQWKVTLEALPPATTGVTMTVKGKNTLTVSNILLGSVWICSGQSNMDFGISKSHRAAQDIPNATCPTLRLFAVAKNTALEPRFDVTVRDHKNGDLLGKWFEATPEQIVRGGWGGFSAVAYYFGRDIQAATGSPVGLIQSSCGATPAQVWVSLPGLEAQPPFTHYTSRVAPYVGQPEKLRAKYQSELAEYESAHQQWEAQKKADPKKIAPEPRRPFPLERSSQTPTALFNAMIAPLIPYAIQGAIWYQGEANCGNPTEYRTLLPRLISDWRGHWGQGDFPFLVVQLPNFMGCHKEPVDTNLARMREAQAMVLQVPNTALVTTIDLGESADIHPLDKADVGHRLALQARKHVFHQDLVSAGPLYTSMAVEGQKIRITFSQTALKIGAGPSIRMDVAPAPPAAELKGFAVAGADRKFHWARAVIEGSSVVVQADQVTAPVAVRYAWDDSPAANLYDQENLPATPFRTDDWPMER